MAFLTLSNIRKEYSGEVAVESLNLSVAHGELVSILGPSGCGKTTILRMIAGLEPTTSGRIDLNGRNITYSKPNERDVGMVFQAYALFPNMTVAENVGFGLRLRHQSGSSINVRVAELLELIHLPDKGDAYPHELSGGQQQRVALARALAIRPQLLLLDEPLSALDARIRDELRNEIRRIQDELGITTIYVTHDQEEAMAISDRVVVMSQGVIEQVGTPFDIYNYPGTNFVASFVGRLNRLPVTVVDPAAGRVRLDDTELLTTSQIMAPAGSTVSLMLRPEELSISSDEENRLVGTVQTVAFLGAIVRVRVQVGDVSVIVDLFNERMLKTPEIGETVTVSFPGHACWVV